MSQWLEHRIPPPVVGALIAAGMWLLARRLGLLPLPDFALKLLLAGLLAAVAALLMGPLAYVLYLNRFQIIPEERALLALFGDDYRHYMARARRWL